MWKAGGTWNKINTIDHVNCHNPVCPINSEMQSPSSSSAPTLRRMDPLLLTLWRGFDTSIASPPSVGDGNGNALASFDIFSRKFIRFCQKPYFIVSLAISSTVSAVFADAVVVATVVVVVDADGDTAVVFTDRNSSLARAPMFDVTTFSSVIFFLLLLSLSIVIYTIVFFPSFFIIFLHACSLLILKYRFGLFFMIPFTCTDLVHIFLVSVLQSRN